jgi:hypothetical protein
MDSMRLEAAGEELVRNGGACDGVQEKDFCPCRCTTVRRAGFDFRKHPVKRSKIFSLLLEELPKPVLEDGFRGFDVVGEPGESHVDVLHLLVDEQCGDPFNDREHDKPHVGRQEFLDEFFTKEQKVPGVFDGLARGCNVKDHDNLKQFRAVGCRRCESCLEGGRSRKRWGCPRADGSTTKYARAGSCAHGAVRDVISIVVSTTRHSCSCQSG